MKIQNLNALMHFHAIAKHRSLSLAAQELHLSAPAVTHSLRGLEESLSQTLCLRTRSGFSLTPAGLELYQSTQKIFAELNSLSSKLQSEEQMSGIFSIGILDNFENTEFELALTKVCKKFPQLRLNLQSFDSETINRLLNDHEIDLGFGVFSNRSSRLKYVKIGEEKLKYYISEKHPLWKKKKISLNDLSQQKVTWLDNRNRKKSDLELNIFVENLKYKMQVYGFTNNLAGALQILLSGHTIVPLPEIYGRPLEKRYSIRPLQIQTKGKTLDQLMAFHPSSSESPFVKEFINQWRHRPQNATFFDQVL